MDPQDGPTKHWAELLDAAPPAMAPGFARQLYPPRANRRTWEEIEADPRIGPLLHGGWMDKAKGRP